MKKPLLIGLTGSIASGKTEVAEFLRKMGAGLISADRLGREVMEESGAMLDWVRESFGDEYFDSEGNLQRRRLGDLVFSQPDQKKLLDRKIFPLIYQRLKSKVKELEIEHSVIVVDAAMIFEWGIESDFDIIVTVAASPETVYRRLSARDGFDLTRAKYRISSQMSPIEKARRSHIIIENDASLEELWRRVEGFWREEVEPRMI